MKLLHIQYLPPVCQAVWVVRDPRPEVWRCSTCSDCCISLSGLSLKLDLFQSTVPQFLEVVLWWSFSSQSRFVESIEALWNLMRAAVFARVCVLKGFTYITLKEWNIVSNLLMIMQSRIKPATKSECRVIDKRIVSLCPSADRCGNVWAQSVRSPQRKHLQADSLIDPRE